MELYLLMAENGCSGDVADRIVFDCKLTNKISDEMNGRIFGFMVIK